MSLIKTEYDRGCIVQAARMVTTLAFAPIDDTASLRVAEHELLRLMRNATQDHTLALGTEAIISVARVIVFAAEGYMPTPHE